MRPPVTPRGLSYTPRTVSDGQLIPPSVDDQRPMRVLTVVTFYRPHWTGLTRFAQRIAEAMAAAGIEVSVLTSRHDHRLPRSEVLDGVRVVRLPTAGRLSRTVLMPTFPAALWREVRRHDVVHLHSPMAEAGLVALACRATGTPLVVTHQGDVVMPAGAVNQAVQRAMVAMLGATFRSAARVVTHNDDYMVHSLTAVAGPRAAAIEPPVPFEPAEPGGAERFRVQHGLAGRPVVAFAGRWVEEKGFDVLLRAAPAVLDSAPDALFVFAGEREVAYERFSEQCQGLVEALGTSFVDVGLLTDPADLAAFYAAADVFVLPSRTDCHASVQVEAMLCGTPVVASDIPGARSVIKRTGAGLLVPPEEPAALARAILDVLGHPGRYDDELAKVPHHYDPARAAKEYADLLVDVCRPAGVHGSRGHELVAGDLDTAYRRRVTWALDRVDPGPGGLLLDAGCGLGNVSAVLERAFPSATVVGVDLSTERLLTARRNGVGSPVAVSDVGRLPLPSDAVDTVLCSEVLEHVDDPRDALRELHRVLRPGGTLVVTVPHADYPWTWDPLNRLRQRMGATPVREGLLAGAWTGHQRLYTPADLDADLAGSGFLVREIEEQTSATIPFGHLVLYGFGRLAVESGVVDGSATPGGRPSPRLARAVVDRVDRLSRTRARGATRFVTIVAAATKAG